MFKKAILGVSRLEIKKRASHRGLRDPLRLPNMDAMKEFVPSALFRNPHAMTIAAAFWHRKFPQLPLSAPRFFDVEPGTQVRAECHMKDNPRAHGTIVLLHGLEGSSDSRYMLGVAEKAWVAGFNVVRLNQRNCGGTESLTRTLYHSGLSCDVRSVIFELIERDGLPEIFAAGFSMGGNLVLKMAGELAAAAPPQIRAFAAVAPALDLAACADALGEPRNFIYERHFVTGLKRRMRLKTKLFPQVFPIDGMRNIRSVRDFDELITARFCNFAGADDYYARSSAGRVISQIRKPTLILTAQDDPFVPFASFLQPAIRDNPCITLIAPKCGGHCAFISQQRGDDRFWAEARVVEFCAQHSNLRPAPPPIP
ncbi:MAG: alpha/beta fold hydrolase [Candidatus Acidiferrales bacterium]